MYCMDDIRQLTYFPRHAKDPDTHDYIYHDYVCSYHNKITHPCITVERISLQPHRIYLVYAGLISTGGGVILCSSINQFVVACEGCHPFNSSRI